MLFIDHNQARLQQEQHLLKSENVVIVSQLKSLDVDITCNFQLQINDIIIIIGVLASSATYFLFLCASHKSHDASLRPIYLFI